MPAIISAIDPPAGSPGAFTVFPSFARATRPPVESGSTRYRLPRDHNESQGELTRWRLLGCGVGRRVQFGLPAAQLHPSDLPRDGLRQLPELQPPDALVGRQVVAGELPDRPPRLLRGAGARGPPPPGPRARP